MVDDPRGSINVPSVAEDISITVLGTRKTRSITEEISDDILGYQDLGCLLPAESEASLRFPCGPILYAPIAVQTERPT